MVIAPVSKTGGFPDRVRFPAPTCRYGRMVIARDWKSRPSGVVGPIPTADEPSEISALPAASNDGVPDESSSFLASNDGVPDESSSFLASNDGVPDESSLLIYHEPIEPFLKTLFKVIRCALIVAFLLWRTLSVERPQGWPYLVGSRSRMYWVSRISGELICALFKSLVKQLVITVLAGVFVGFALVIIQGYRLGRYLIKRVLFAGHIVLKYLLSMFDRERR